jgi:hypothetical protein
MMADSGVGPDCLEIRADLLRAIAATDPGLDRDDDDNTDPKGARP